MSKRELPFWVKIALGGTAGAVALTGSAPVARVSQIVEGGGGGVALKIERYTTIGCTSGCVEGNGVSYTFINSTPLANGVMWCYYEVSRGFCP